MGNITEPCDRRLQIMNRKQRFLVNSCYWSYCTRYHTKYYTAHYTGKISDPIIRLKIPYGYRGRAYFWAWNCSSRMTWTIRHGWEIKHELVTWYNHQQMVLDSFLSDLKSPHPVIMFWFQIETINPLFRKCLHYRNQIVWYKVYETKVLGMVYIKWTIFDLLYILTMGSMIL